MSCNNPCGAGPGNTAACESLPSQIQNFTDQFFGTVIKTEVNGVVSWSLPCSLDVGLPNNPRGTDEGLACYFLRLFQDGIVGLTGPQGDPGVAGANGNNAYAVTLHTFTQPTLAAPVVNVAGSFNPAILEGLYIFIDTSGWYHVDGTDGNGTLFLTLVRAETGASGTISAGKLIVPSGFPGASVTGPTGPQGSTGAQGTPGASFTATNAYYYATVGTDYAATTGYAAVDFVNSSPSQVLPATGTYLVIVNAQIQGEAGSGAATTGSFKLYNVSVAADVPGTERTLQGFLVGVAKQIVLTAVVTTDAPSQTVSFYAKCSVAGQVSVTALNTSMKYVRLS